MNIVIQFGLIKCMHEIFGSFGGILHLNVIATQWGRQRRYLLSSPFFPMRKLRIGEVKVTHPQSSRGRDETEPENSEGKFSVLSRGAQVASTAGFDCSSDSGKVL